LAGFGDPSGVGDWLWAPTRGRLCQRPGYFR
jgi:hypothetical protein